MKFDYAEVKNWALITENNPYRAPELNSVRLCGKVYGSKSFKDGSQIATSAVLRMIEEQGIIVVETMNSKYIISKGEALKEHKDKMGNVWEKLLNSINSNG
jgi:hypothetical protein